MQSREKLSKQSCDRKNNVKVMDYTELSQRLKKSLYYGSLPKTERPSLPLTNLVVENCNEIDNLFLEKLCLQQLSHLALETCLSPCSVVLAMIYVERLTLKNPNFIASISSSKLFLISMMVAAKFLNDCGEEDEVFNDEWAASANMELPELNQLERDFLTAIDWLLYVNEEEFAEKLAKIERQIAKNEGQKRGWLTYTDMDILTQHCSLFDVWDLIISHILNVSFACTTAYLASLVTLVSSAIVVSSLPWNIPKPTTISHPTIDISGNELLHASARTLISDDSLADPTDKTQDLDGNLILTNISRLLLSLGDDLDLATVPPNSRYILSVDSGGPLNSKTELSQQLSVTQENPRFLRQTILIPSSTSWEVSYVSESLDIPGEVGENSTQSLPLSLTIHHNEFKNSDRILSCSMYSLFQRTSPQVLPCVAA